MAVLSLELNELNFSFIQEFIRRGKLPNFARLLREHQLVETIAEKAYPELEPWIQWPTVYTGKAFAEHGIFRLGDIVERDHVQIWEYLERRGLKVAAVSPMNAANRCADPAFFLPDPWTQTEVTADRRVSRLFDLICQVVNANASSDLSIARLGPQLLPLALPYISAGSIPKYLRILRMATQYKWAKAAFLDRLLADMTFSLMRKHRPDYTSLFLNAGAHIQHHHMYDSAIYSGGRSNPGWYSKAAETDVDPLLFIYEVYDEIAGEALAMPDCRVMITTGLSQIANERDHYQYRIADLQGFVADLRLEGASAQPRMSRDFLLEFPDRALAKKAIAGLDAVRCAGAPLFNVEDRGLTLFCQVGYFGPPEGLKQISIDGRVGDRSGEFVLVSIENGIHQTIGYHVDAHGPKTSDEARIPLVDVFGRLTAAALAERPLPVQEAA